MHKTTGNTIRCLREQRGIPLRKIAALLDIDTSFYSKIERGLKKATKAQILQLELFFEVEKNSLLIIYLSEKIYYELLNEDCAGEVLKIAGERIEIQNCK